MQRTDIKRIVTQHCMVCRTIANNRAHDKWTIKAENPRLTLNYYCNNLGFIKTGKSTCVFGKVKITLEQGIEESKTLIITTDQVQPVYKQLLHRVRFSQHLEIDETRKAETFSILDCNGNQLVFTNSRCN